MFKRRFHFTSNQCLSFSLLPGSEEKREPTVSCSRRWHHAVLERTLVIANMHSQVVAMMSPRQHMTISHTGDDFSREKSPVYSTHTEEMEKLNTFKCLHPVKSHFM